MPWKFQITFPWAPGTCWPVEVKSSFQDVSQNLLGLVFRASRLPDRGMVWSAIPPLIPTVPQRPPRCPQIRATPLHVPALAPPHLPPLTLSLFQFPDVLSSLTAMTQEETHFLSMSVRAQIGE